MAKYLTRQRRQLLKYLSKHTDEQMTARQIADALEEYPISISAIYRSLSALEEEGLLKRSVREGTRELYYQHRNRSILYKGRTLCGRDSGRADGA